MGTKARKKMKIAVFGGSFDPVHSEHVHIARAAIAELQLDKLLVMPAFSPPHKPWKRLAPDSDRLHMCKLAFQDMEKAEVCDYEIARGDVSYTYLTCRYFRSLYQDAEIYWLVGTDMLRDFPTWKNPQSILNDVTLAVCARNETDWIDRESQAFYERFGKKFVTVSYVGKNVSSTEVRVFAGAGVLRNDLVPENVAAYIEENKIYEIPFAKEALALEKTARREHSVRVAQTAARMAMKMRISERQALTAAFFHDCAKNLPSDSPFLQDFTMDAAWGDVPAPVVHQFTGAYLAEHIFHVTDREVLDAIRYHTSGRADMSSLEKLIFLADMLEDGRDFDGVDELRRLFWQDGVDACLRAALRQSLQFIKEKGEKIYPLTESAYRWICAVEG